MLSLATHIEFRSATKVFAEHGSDSLTVNDDVITLNDMQKSIDKIQISGFQKWHCHARIFHVWQVF